MRYFDFTLTPASSAIHPVDEVIAEQPAVTREALMHVDALGDGTGILLYELRGDPDQVVPELEAADEVLALDLLEVAGEEFHLYLHVLPGDPAGSLMTIAREYGLMVDTPLEYTEGAGLRTRVIGTHEMVQQALEEVPDDVTVAIQEVGEYAPGPGDVLSRLTDRQLEVFRTAVDLGYYEIPRRATHQEIADELGCAPSTIDEHLRKAESQVLSTLVS